MPISQGIMLTTSVQQVFQATEDCVLRWVGFTNTGSTDVTINVYLVKNGETPSDQNRIFADIIIPTKDTFILDEDRILMEAGDSIYAQASEDSVVNFVASWYPLTS